MMTNCTLCQANNDILVWQNALCRVVLVNEPDYPGFCRVITQAHVKEMTDLSENAQLLLMRVVFAVEEMLREVLKPDKINLASLGNIVPHLHWHIIPRFVDDKHFPNPIWGEVTKNATASVKKIDLDALKECIREKLDNMTPSLPTGVLPLH